MRSPVIRYGFALAATVAAVVLIVLLPNLREGAFVLLAAAALFSGWFSGIRIGLISLLIGVAAIFIFIIIPHAVPLNLNFFVRFGTYIVLVIFVMVILRNYEE